MEVGKSNIINSHDDIVKFLAAKYNLDEETIEKVVRAQFRFVKDTIEQGELDSVHLQAFGKIAVKPGRMKYLEEEGYEIKKKVKQI